MESVGLGPASTPLVVATGFTTAFLGDERTLREFIIGDHMRAKLVENGDNAVLYLINDSYDPLNARQLRLGVNKDETLINRFRPFCGRPISEVPDPFDCHSSYSDHHLEGLLQRLHALDIHPAVLDAYRSYGRGHYAEYVATTFRDYSRIRDLLAARFPHHIPRDLFRVQCPRCLCLDSTSIREVKGQDVRFDCERCGLSSLSDVAGLKGKLSWKLECAVRWNLHRIDYEAFAKSHLADQGTLGVAQLLAERIFGGKIPEIVRYGDVRISRDLAGHLLQLLPPSVLKELFLSHLPRDLHLTRDSVLAFSQKCHVRPGVSYLDWVRRELPQASLRWSGWRQPEEEAPAGQSETWERVLVHHGNRFSRFYYGRSYDGLCAPELKLLETAEAATLSRASEILSRALSFRKGNPLERRNARALIRSHLRSQGTSPEIYRFLRRVLGQREGPSLGTLLSLLPLEYLTMVRALCALAIAGSLRLKVSSPEGPAVLLSEPVEDGPVEAAVPADGTYGPAFVRGRHADGGDAA